MTTPARADIILTNGRIYTVDPEKPWAEAVAIAGGRILAVGDAAKIATLKGEHTETIDLGGRMAMPGFADVHNHILMGGQADLFVPNELAPIAPNFRRWRTTAGVTRTCAATASSRSPLSVRSFMPRNSSSG